MGFELVVVVFYGGEDAAVEGWGCGVFGEGLEGWDVAAEERFGGFGFWSCWGWSCHWFGDGWVDGEGASEHEVGGLRFIVFAVVDISRPCLIE